MPEGFWFVPEDMIILEMIWILYKYDHITNNFPNQNHSFFSLTTIVFVLGW